MWAWGRDGVQDVGRFIFQIFLRLDVKGLENLPKAGERTIIAPNHVSLLDGPIMHAILPGHAAFAIDTSMAEKSWVKPFLKVINAVTLDPTKPLATRALVNTVKSGQTIVIFPEGRLTVTGGLMKVYDGTAMIADKADAWIVSVRIEGPERSRFSYLRPAQIRKAWFPKTTVTILEPRKLSVSPDLKGKARRQAAGARLQDIMVDTAVETARIDRPCSQPSSRPSASRRPARRPQSRTRSGQDSPTASSSSVRRFSPTRSSRSPRKAVPSAFSSRTLPASRSPSSPCRPSAAFRP